LEVFRAYRTARQKELDELVADYVRGAPADLPGLTRDAVLADWQTRFAKDGHLMIYKSAGCKRCSQKGLRGRLGLHELMTNSRELRRMIQKRAAPSELQACAMFDGLRTLRQDGIEKVLQGLTSIEEVRATSNE